MAATARTPAAGRGREDVLPSLLDAASLVANLAGWHGFRRTQPWYQWLASDALLVHGGESYSEPSDRDAGRANALYRLPLPVLGVADRDDKTLLARQRPEPLDALRRLTRISGFNGVAAVSGSVSPDGRWLLFVDTGPPHDGPPIRDSGRTPVEQHFYWCAAPLDGNRPVVVWPMEARTAEYYDSTRPFIELTCAEWLPDSSGILEFYADWANLDHRDDARRRGDVMVTGQVRFLDSPASPISLPCVRLGTLPGADAGGPLSYQVNLFPRSASDRGAADTVDLRVLAVHDRPPSFDRGVTRSDVFQWEWKVGGGRQRAAAPTAAAKEPVVTARSQVVNLPRGAALRGGQHSRRGCALSRRGDRLVWALLDRTTFPTNDGAAVNGLWLTEVNGSGSSVGRGPFLGPLRQIGSLPFPQEKASWYWERFGLGEWVPDGGGGRGGSGQRRVSFQIGKLVYTLPVP